MSKQIKISLAVILLLVTAIVCKQFVHFSNTPTLKGWNSQPDEITAARGTQTVKLYIKETRWLIGPDDYFADGLAVDDLLKKFEEMKLTDLISKKAVYERYELTDESSWHVTIKQKGKVLREVYIGKNSSAGTQCYVRLAGKPEVYLAQGRFADEFSKPVADWRDKKVFSFAPADVESVTIQYNGTHTVLKKVKKKEAPADAKSKDAKKQLVTQIPDEWTDDAGQALDVQRIKSFTSQLSPFMLKNFSTRTMQTLGIPAAVITVVERGKTHELKIYTKEQDGTYLSVSSDMPYVFTIDEFRAKNFFKISEDFKVK